MKIVKDVYVMHSGEWIYHTTKMTLKDAEFEAEQYTYLTGCEARIEWRDADKHRASTIL